jgi:hypothetical protein
MKDLMTSVPGIDEAMAFAELMKMVRESNDTGLNTDTGIVREGLYGLVRHLGGFI